jgi:8-oxo-dGTP pyrophosphatase MutT (NUDIX family)
MSSSFEMQMELLGAAPSSAEALVKSRIPGYTKRDGTYVKPHSRTGEAHAHVAQQHPRAGEKGEVVVVHQPSHASAVSTWHSPNAVATFLPDGDVPASLNGIQLRQWKDHPTTAEGWDYVDGVNDDLVEPKFKLPPGKKAASGVIIQEPDGRVWLVAPTNAFGGYEATFPKGTAEPDLSLQANAIKEAFEECGLQVEITGLLGDYERTTSVARMYTAKRVGGTPIAMGWESQAVHLVPKDKLYDVLNMWSDHSIVEDIGGGSAPAASNKQVKGNTP